MAVIHRLVIVVGFFGGLVMVWYLMTPVLHPSVGEALITVAIPGIAAAIILYPIGWLFRRRRGAFTYRVL